MKKTLLAALAVVFSLGAMAQDVEKPEGLIKEKPAGELKLYRPVAGTWVYFDSKAKKLAPIDCTKLGGLKLETRKELDRQVVIAPNGTDVYMKNCVSTVGSSYWIKGTKNGNKLTFPTQQCIIWWDADDKGPAEGVMACIAKVGTNDEGKEGYVIDEDDTEFSYELDGNSLALLETSHDKDNVRILAVSLMSKPGVLGYFEFQTVYEYDEEATQAVTAAAIQGVQADTNNEVVGVKYFDLSGRQIAKPANGVSIQKVEYSNGAQKATKIIGK